MSKCNKRLRQISITESFANNKKNKNNFNCLTLKENIRELFEASTDKRMECKEEKGTNIETKESLYTQQAATSHVAFEEEKLEEPDSEEIFVPSSQEIFSNSDELFPTQSVSEIPPTPEGNLKVFVAISDSALSAEIFTEDNDTETLPIADTNSDSEDQKRLLLFLNRIPDCRIPLPELEPLENHFISFSPHIRPFEAPRPYPSTYRDRWDFDHVRMPCSPQNKYPVEDLNGEKQIKSRWDLISRSLRRNIKTSQQLEEAIMMYNSQYRNKWNFNSLHAFFDKHVTKEQQTTFFESILPAMIDIALNLPNICTQPLPLLKKNKDFYITISQKQIGCLLLNAFFCTFPRRNQYTRYRRDNLTNEYSSYPDINFNRLFFGVKNRISSSNAEKLKCLFNYFTRLVKREPSGTVTFHRQTLKNLPNWKESVRGIKTAVIKSSGLIETEGNGMLQVDFANKFVGGGVLGHGCVQEEIRFVICPELIISRLFVECLGPVEALIVTGVEQYNSYSGYRDDFKWEDNFNDTAPRDDWGRKCTEVVAIDAFHFKNKCEQYKSFRIERELNKAFCGFFEDAYPDNLSAVATGNWGCGVFNGNPMLKFLIQLMAASQANRDLLYFTFGSKRLKKELQNIYKLISEKNLSVGDLWRILMKYCNTFKVLHDEPDPSLYDFIHFLFDEDNNADEAMNSQASEINDSEQQALVKLIENIVDSSGTEIEDDDTIINDHG